MRWAKLSLQHLPAVRKETDEVVETITQLASQVKRPDVYSVRTIGTNCSLVLAKLLRACRGRIHDMEAFYLAHDLEANVEQIETLRHKLKRAVRVGEAAVTEAGDGAFLDDHRSTPTPTPRIPAPRLGKKLTRDEVERAKTSRDGARRGRGYLTKGHGSLVWETSTHRPGGHSFMRLRGAAGLLSETPWIDPGKFSHRPPQQAEKWITAGGFNTIIPTAPKHVLPHASKCTGSSAGPWRTGRAEVVLTRTERPELDIDPSSRFTPIVGGCL
eukprot:TRINITY_DN12502_c0_g1_i1.p1 TRINITY_DN12502_c0_g1~~TRINITY_DN12502_c0_g1_i1.p1  ORF type:complete len:271 (+),score=58.94 TRINITY_DN12502_c0_g1_i1:93-905(+)